MVKRIFKNKGFTLVELLVVIAIIGLLASIILVSTSGARAKARDAKRLAQLSEVSTAMEMCYDSIACGQSATITDYLGFAAAGTGAIPAIGNFLSSVTDPLNSGSFVYGWLSNAAVQGSAAAYQYYCIYALLETEAGTYTCISNKGTAKSTTAPVLPTCCGMNLGTI